MKNADFNREVLTARRELVVRLLFDAFTCYRDTLFKRMETLGFPGINMQHSLVLRAMAPEGSLMRDVTRRSGASRQVIARIVTELERQGYVSLTADAADGRNQMIAFTPKGRRLARASIRAGKFVETQMSARLGAAGLKELRRLLQLLTSRDAGR